MVRPAASQRRLSLAACALSRLKCTARSVDGCRLLAYRIAAMVARS
jgi:hypothetical protein